MYVWVDLVEEELAEYVWTRGGIALELVPIALSVEVGEDKECHGRQPKVVGVDVDHPTITA